MYLQNITKEIGEMSVTDYCNTILFNTDMFLARFNNVLYKEKEVQRH